MKSCKFKIVSLQREAGGVDWKREDTASRLSGEIYALLVSTASGALVVGGVRDISHPSIHPSHPIPEIALSG